MKKLKTKLYFNRINMQRGKSEVWTASNSRACNQATKIVVRHDGVVVLETVYDPDARQSRAYLVGYGNVIYEGETVVVEV